jgi:hypothetical protein
LDSVTITSDADGTVNFTVAGANLTITDINASASAGTLVFNSAVSGAAITLTTGSGDNTITTELNQADTVTLASGAGDDTIIILDDTTAADVITNFEAGANGDVVSIDVSAIVGGLDTAGDAALSDALAVSIVSDANGDLVAVTANTNIIVLTQTYADIAAVFADLDLVANGDGGATLLDDGDAMLVVWSNGGSTFISSVEAAGEATFDAGANLVELAGVTVTDLTAANFAFV